MNLRNLKNGAKREDTVMNEKTTEYFIMSSYNNGIRDSMLTILNLEFIVRIPVLN
jgi:hypothetical protein